MAQGGSDCHCNNMCVRNSQRTTRMLSRACQGPHLLCLLPAEQWLLCSFTRGASAEHLMGAGCGPYFLRVTPGQWGSERRGLQRGGDGLRKYRPPLLSLLSRLCCFLTRDTLPGVSANNFWLTSQHSSSLTASQGDQEGRKPSTSNGSLSSFVTQCN